MADGKNAGRSMCWVEGHGDTLYFDTIGNSFIYLEVI